MMMGLVGASTLAGRPLDEGFNHDEPKPKRKTRPSSKTIRYEIRTEGIHHEQARVPHR